MDIRHSFSFFSRDPQIRLMTFMLMLIFGLPLTGMSQSDTYLLRQIAGQQQQTTGFFYKGSFPSYRLYGAGNQLKPDNNIFFTGLIAFTLKELKPALSPAQQAICDSVIRRAEQAYPYFRNKNNRPTYSFWQTNPPLVFPNSGFLSLFNKSHALPDDLDDTSILWLSQNPSDSILALVKQLMAAHANGRSNRVKNIYRAYRDIPAYSTWFGVKMPIDFDFCVLCNVLYFVYASHLPLNKHDSATITLLKKMVTDGYYKTKPSYISPHYGRTPLLLYHISRLTARFSIPALDSLQPELLKAAYEEYHTADNWMDSVLLSTAILRMHGNPLPVSSPDSADLYVADKTFFVASFAEMLPDFWKKLLMPAQWMKYYFICPAYRQTLYLENRILARDLDMGADKLFIICLNIFSTL